MLKWSLYVGVDGFSAPVWKSPCSIFVLFVIGFDFCHCYSCYAEAYLLLLSRTSMVFLVPESYYLSLCNTFYSYNLLHRVINS